MATFAVRPSGGYSIQFFDLHGKTQTITLKKKYSPKVAKELRDVVAQLVYNRDNAIEICDKRTQAWIESAVPEIQSKLARVGLIFIPDRHTAKELWDKLIEVKEGESLKDSTLKNYQIARKRFFEFFKENDFLCELTAERMLQWKAWLVESNAKATAACTLTRAKTAFLWAVRNGWLEKSPLEGIGRGSYINRENDFFVSMEIYHQLLDACPSLEWRVILALARIGGLRTPSEAFALKWADILWDKDRFYVTSSKTARYEGKGGRWVPLFPGLREMLDELFFEAEDGAEKVIDLGRGASTSLSSAIGQIIKRAGLEKFPRPFDNMRASRATEIYQEFGPYKESKWIGHSHKIALDHYLQMTDSDFTLAAGGSIIQTPHPPRRPPIKPDTASGGAKTPQKPPTPGQSTDFT